MTMCAKCQDMKAAGPKASPHDDLKQTDAKSYKTFGHHTAIERSYECRACGTKWVYDEDKNDEHAGWGLA